MDSYGTTDFHVRLSLLREAPRFNTYLLVSHSICGRVICFLALWKVGRLHIVFLNILIKDIYSDHCLNKGDWETYV